MDLSTLRTLSGSRYARRKNTKVENIYRLLTEIRHFYVAVNKRNIYEQPGEYKQDGIEESDTPRLYDWRYYEVYGHYQHKYRNKQWNLEVKKNKESKSTLKI